MLPDPPSRVPPVYHLKCLESSFDINRTCKQCFVGMNGFINNSGVKIVHQNIRSLLPKIDELRLLISSVQSKIDLITLSETWLTDDVSESEVNIEGYTFHRRDRGSKEKGEGLEIYVRINLSVNRRFDLEQSNIESLWVEVNFPHSCGFLIGTFYQPPESSRYYNDAFMDHFEDSAEKAISNNKEVISKSGVRNACLSDHDLIYCIRKMNCKQSIGQTKSFRNYARYNSSAFFNDLRGVDWEKQMNSILPNATLSVIDRMWSNFKSAFISVADRHAPVISKR